MANHAKSFFSAQFRLKPEPFQAHILDKRFEIGREMYNKLLAASQRRYREMAKTREYRELMKQLKNCPTDETQDIESKLDDIRAKYRISEQGFLEDVEPMQRHFSGNIDELSARNIALRLWAAYEELLSGKVDNLQSASPEQFDYIEGEPGNGGIEFADGFLMWGDRIKVPVAINRNDAYEVEALQHEIARCRIVRKITDGKSKYYLQIVFKGVSPRKTKKQAAAAIS